MSTANHKPYFSSSFIKSDETKGRDAAFLEALASNRALGATRGIDAALKEHQLDALVLPVPVKRSPMAAGLAGYPIVTGMPIILTAVQITHL